MSAPRIAIVGASSWVAVCILTRLFSSLERSLSVLLADSLILEPATPSCDVSQRCQSCSHLLNDYSLKWRNCDALGPERPSFSTLTKAVSHGHADTWAVGDGYSGSWRTSLSDDDRLLRRALIRSSDRSDGRWCLRTRCLVVSALDFASQSTSGPADHALRARSKSSVSLINAPVCESNSG